MEHRPDLLPALCRQSLFAFARCAFNRLHADPADRLVANWHIQAICHALEAAVAGKTRKLIITVPPRHLKSVCTSVALPAWLLGRDPSAKMLVASYGDALAARHSRDSRRLMETPFYRQVFPRTGLKLARELELETTAGGFRRAVSLGGPVTGLGGDWLIIDDLMKAADAPSPAMRQKVKDYYTDTLFSRLNDKQDGRIIVIQQRLHEDDLVGHLLESGTFEHLNLPAIADKDEVIAIGQGRTHRRRAGEPLCPQRESLETLNDIRLEIGNVAFSAQYLQNPVPPGGNRMRWEWFGTYDERPPRSWFHYVLQSWDTAMTAEPSSDFSVCMTWGFRERKWYLLDLHRARYDYPDLLKRALSLDQDWQPDRILIEQAGTGHSLHQDLRRRGLTRKMQLILPCNDKETRFEAQTAKLETGDFLIPRDAPWLDEFRRECLAFPSGKYDDQVDAMAQFLWWTGSRRGSGFIERGNKPHPQPRNFGRRVTYG